MRPSLTLLAAGLALSAASAAAAQDTDPARTRPFRSPRYPASTDAPPAAGTSIRAPGTVITNESSAETATGITGSGDRRRQGPGGR